MISDRLIALVRCPECRGTIVRTVDSVDGLRCQMCGRAYRAPGGEYLDLRPADEFAEQTKYLDEALHADARHERVSPPLLGSKIRNDMLRRFLRPGAAIWSSISAAAADGRSSGTATSAPRWSASTSARSSPRTRDATCRCCSATCGGCRLLTATFTKGVVARRPRAPLARRAPRDADGSQPRARTRGPALRLHPRAQERARRRRPALDQPLRARPGARRPDRHASGTPAQVRSPQPARRRARSRTRRATRADSASSASRSTRRSSAGSSRTS